tara:strand:- start:2 stop:472 length:471 start_codon:yes stop_codon:yes gene_type:complete
MSWQDILKNRKTYTENDMERLAPYWWSDLVREMAKEPEFELFGFGTSQEDDVYQDTWDKFTSDKNWLNNIKWWKPWFDVSDTEKEMREKVLRFEPNSLEDYNWSDKTLDFFANNFSATGGYTISSGKDYNKRLGYIPSKGRLTERFFQQSKKNKGD